MCQWESWFDTTTLILILTILVKGEEEIGIHDTEEKVFSFPEFDYIESSKNEIAFKEWEAACSQTPACLGHQPFQKLRCVRKCISPSCYNEIYAFDELEEGEIDIRFQSFKGCFIQRLHKRRL